MKKLLLATALSLFATQSFALIEARDLSVTIPKQNAINGQASTITAHYHIDLYNNTDKKEAFQYIINLRATGASNEFREVSKYIIIDSHKSYVLDKDESYLANMNASGTQKVLGYVVINARLVSKSGEGSADLIVS